MRNTAASRFREAERSVTEPIGAIDLGSAWTVVYSPKRGALLDEPTVVAHGRSGRVVATGRRALAPAMKHGSDVRLPVRRGLVADPTDCVHLLADLLARAALEPGTPVRLAVPAGASSYDVALLTGVVFSVTGGPATTVPSLLAGARGARLDTRRPLLLWDIGAGLTEIGVIEDDRLVASASAPIGIRDYKRNGRRALEAWAGTQESVLGALPAALRSVLAGAPVRLIGGGARVEGLGDQLRAAWGRPVERFGDVRHAVAKGLLLGTAAPLQAA